MKYLALILFLLISCGDEVEYDKKPDYSGPIDSGLVFTPNVKAAINRNCKSCHPTDKFISDANLFKTQGQPRVINGSMPPGGNISKEDKALLINF